MSTRWSRTAMNTLTGTGGVAMSKIGVLLALFLLAAPVSAAAVDRFVNPNNTCSPGQAGGNPEYDTIQDAVNASGPGDVIIVCPDTYQESVIIAVDNLSLLGLPPSCSRPRRFWVRASLWTRRTSPFGASRSPTAAQASMCATPRSED